MEITFKVGDKIIRSGQVFRIFKIEKNKSGEEVIYFKPVFSDHNNGDLICSIPVKNFDMTTLRRPLEAKEIMTIKRKLAKFDNLEYPTDVNTVKDMLKLNNPKKTAKAIKSLWIEKLNEDKPLSRSKKEAIDLAMCKFVEEMAFVLDDSLEKMAASIEKSLNRGAKAYLADNPNLFSPQV